MTKQNKLFQQDANTARGQLNSASKMMLETSREDEVKRGGSLNISNFELAFLTASKALLSLARQCDRETLEAGLENSFSATDAEKATQRAALALFDELAAQNLLNTRQQMGPGGQVT